ncbi:MAG: hypothetical protein JNJ58_05590 [Chitinophagaceae bacterium]|nr:hypothetical protein [Chitinophagaceae bacterium]
MNYIKLIYVVVLILFCNSCISDEEYSLKVAKNYINYEEIKKAHPYGVESFDSSNNTRLYQTFYDVQHELIMEDIYLDPQYNLLKYDFHYFIQNKILIFSYDYFEDTFSGATFFLESDEFTIVDPVKDTIYLHAARPPGFISSSKIYQFNSEHREEINLHNKLNNRNNTYIILDKNIANTKNTYIARTTLTPIDNNRKVIKDSLIFTFGNNETYLLSPAATWE